jgi:hypothetical protein
MSDVPPLAGLGGRRAASGSHVGPLRGSFTAWHRPFFHEETMTMTTMTPTQQDTPWRA